MAFVQRAGDLHGHIHPATLQTGQNRQVYQGGVGRSPTIYFLLMFDYFLKKITQF